jgi:yecA family protein
LRCLGTWLALRKPHEGHLEDIHSLDGFLACVAVSPEAVPLGQWLSWIFHFKAALRNEWPYVDMMVRRLAHVMHGLEESPASYVPWLESGAAVEGMLAALHAWSQGFVLATELQDEQWGERLGDPQVARWMYPIWDAAEPHSRRSDPFDLAMLKRAVLTFKRVSEADGSSA